jgi:hypothetical protein
MIRTNKKPIMAEISDSDTVQRIQTTASNVGEWAQENKTPLIGGVAVAAAGLAGYLVYRFVSDRS